MGLSEAARCLFERIDGADRAVETSVLEILRNELGQAVILDIGPHVRVVPWKLVCDRTPDRKTEDLLVGIEDAELHE